MLKTRLLFTGLAVLATATLFGCGPSGPSGFTPGVPQPQPSQAPTVDFTFNLTGPPRSAPRQVPSNASVVVLPSNTSSIAVLFFGASGQVGTTQTVAVNGQTSVQDAVTIPTGATSVQVQALNASGKIIAEGQAAVSANAGVQVVTFQHLVVGLTVSPPTVSSLAIGSTQALTATENFDDNTTQDVTTQAAWSSSNAAAATVVANTGVVTGVAAGTSTITASFAGFQATSSVTTVAPVSTKNFVLAGDQSSANMDEYLVNNLATGTLGSLTGTANASTPVATSDGVEDLIIAGSVLYVLAPNGVSSFSYNPGTGAVTNQSAPVAPTGGAAPTEFMALGAAGLYVPTSSGTDLFPVNGSTIGAPTHVSNQSTSQMQFITVGSTTLLVTARGTTVDAFKIGAGGALTAAGSLTTAHAGASGLVASGNIIYIGESGGFVETSTVGFDGTNATFSGTTATQIEAAGDGVGALALGNNVLYSVLTNSNTGNSTVQANAIAGATVTATPGSQISVAARSAGLSSILLLSSPQGSTLYVGFQNFFANQNFRGAVIPFTATGTTLTEQAAAVTSGSDPQTLVGTSVTQ